MGEWRCWPRRGGCRREAWHCARGLKLLDVPYCHRVSAPLLELNANAPAEWDYDATLLECSAAKLKDSAAAVRWKDGIGAFTLVQPSWGAGHASPRVSACTSLACR